MRGSQGVQSVFYGLVLAIHVVICLVLILVVLMQAGKGGGLAGAFGAAGGQTGQMLFGGRGAATFLSKATSVLGGAFLAISLLLALMSSARGGAESVLRQGSLAPGSVTPAVDAPSPTDPNIPLVPAPAGLEGETGTTTPVPGIAEPADGQTPSEGEPAAEEPAPQGGGQ